MNKTILIISHVVPEPAIAGDSLRLRNLIRFFKAEGYNIICLFKGKLDQAKVISDTKELIDEVFFASDFKSFKTLFNKPYQLWKIFERGSVKAFFYDLHLAYAVKSLCKRYSPEVIMAEYIFMAPYFRYAPDGSLKIIDTIDVFARKAQEVCKHGIEFPLACTEDEERKYLLNADLILGIQPQESKLLQNMIPKKDVITVGVDMPLKERDSEGVCGSKKVLFVGGGNPNNIHGIEEFLCKSWGMIYKQFPDASLRIVGSICNKIDNSKLSDGVCLVGIVDDLEDEYLQADVVVNPVVAGTGLKIKTIEAMSYGKPIVSTPNGVEGITVYDSSCTPFVVADSPELFSKEIVALLENSEKSRKLCRDVRQYSGKYFNSQYIYKDLKDKLDSHEE